MFTNPLNKTKFWIYRLKINQKSIIESLYHFFMIFHLLRFFLKKMFIMWWSTLFLLFLFKKQSELKYTHSGLVSKLWQPNKFKGTNTTTTKNALPVNRNCVLYHYISNAVTIDRWPNVLCVPLDVVLVWCHPHHRNYQCLTVDAL